MANYATRQMPPTALTAEERKRLLGVSGKYSDTFRDHMVFSMAIGTGGRLFELQALHAEHVWHPDGSVRKRTPELPRFKGQRRANDHGSKVRQELILPRNLRRKLERFRNWKSQRGESLEPSAPLFVSRQGNPWSKRSIQEAFMKWQREASFVRRRNFHALRHTFGYLVRARVHDAFELQRLMRHSSMDSTMVYMRLSDEELAAVVEDLPC